MLDSRRTALVGYTGTVGQALLAQAKFSDHFRSTNADEMKGRSFARLYCAGAPGTKYLANADPQADRRKIERLKASLVRANSAHFILFSTVDVFATPRGVTEDTVHNASTPYGQHRADLENFVQQHFGRHLIVRLPALVGETIKKNSLYDLKNRHNLENLSSEASFQFYPLRRLMQDVERAIELGLTTLHLSVAPLQLGLLASRIFGISLQPGKNQTAAKYDLHSRHGAAFGRGLSRYLVPRTESWAEIEKYAERRQ